jgi:hypothetical protein
LRKIGRGGAGKGKGKEAGGDGEWGIFHEIEDKPWGYREFTVRDGDGNRLSFFCFLEDGEEEEDEEEKKPEVDG